MHQINRELPRLSRKEFRYIPATYNNIAVNGTEVKAQLDHKSSRRHFRSARLHTLKIGLCSFQAFKLQNIQNMVFITNY